MNTERFEIFFRNTLFSRALLAALWDGLSTLERIDLLLLIKDRDLPLPQRLLIKALKDPSPVIRMLTVRVSYIKEDSNLYKKVQTDSSPFVKAALELEKGFWEVETKDRLSSLNHPERLGAIALCDSSLNDKKFAEFIIEGLRNKIISEAQAQELVIEFVRNPHQIKSFQHIHTDGLDWYAQRSDFEAIWNLTTCTPPLVHIVIAHEYPLETGDSGTIPDNILDSMSQEALEQLVFRDYQPLLSRIESNPDQFSERILEAVRHGAEYEAAYGNLENHQPKTEVGELREELHQLRTEIEQELEKISRQIEEATTRRRGLFG